MKILVTGGTGLVGTAIKTIVSESTDSYVFLSSKDCDLTSLEETRQLFEKLNPDYVIHLAGNVGGLYKNMHQKVDMFEINLLINFNVLKCCHDFKVKKVVSCLSTCIFPDKTTYPIDETMLHNGPPHWSNDAYAHSKRMLEVHSKAYQEQYNDNFICVIPTNIYGPADNYSLENGHVIPALIHRCYLAKQKGEDFTVKGTGKPLRQFVYSEDMAELMLWTLFDYKEKETIILANDEKDEISIETAAREIAKCFDYEDRLKFDSSFSDGQYKKTASNSKLRKYLPDYNFTDFSTGIRKSVDWFISNYDIARK